MSKKCLYCGKKLGVFSTKAMTRDGFYLCKTDMDKLFDVAKLPTNVQKFWIRKHKSQEIFDILSSGKQVDGHVAASELNLHAIEQSKAIKEKKKQLQEQRIEAHRPRCPKCGSTDLSILGQHKKGFSVGKAVVGGVLTGGVGTLAGFAGKKTKKVDYVCNNCGTTFTH
jgi:Zn finger protein HypA/HybF involved in hydrogenase expression